MSAMPETATPPERRPLPWHSIAYYAAPACVFLAVVVQFLRFNEYSLFLPASGILIVSAALVGIALGAVARHLPSAVGLVVIVASVGVYMLYSEDFLGLLAPLYGIATGAVGPQAGLVLVGILLLAGISLVVLLLREHLPMLTTAVFGTIVVTSIVLPTSKGGEPIREGALPERLNDLPPVIHIILDEHIGLGGLPPEIEASGGVAETLRATYADFALYRWAYSRFGETQYSLAGLLNGEDVSAMPELLAFEDASYTLSSNAWFDKLKAKGYAIHVYQTPWLDFCHASPTIDVCDTYPMYSPNAIQRSSLPMPARLRVLLASLNPTGSRPILGPLASRETLARFRSDLREAPRGVAYFVHLLLPHSDYIYAEDCTLRDPRRWGSQEIDQSTPEERRAAYGLYLAQVSCTAKSVLAVFDELKQLDIYDQATIIVHGDHGSRIGERGIHAPAKAMSERDLLDHFSTFLAVKGPDTTPGVHDEPVELQSFFAATYLGQERGSAQRREVVVRDDTTNAFTRRTLALPQSPVLAGSAHGIAANAGGFR